MLDRRDSDVSDTTLEAEPEAQPADAIAPPWLLPVSLTYLALPTLIFVAGWTRPLIALISGACVVAVVAMSIRSAATRPKHALPRVTTAGIWGGATVFGLLTGAGGYVPQSWDWLKHNAIVRDLVTQPWPVSYDIEGNTFQLTYYIGYYLPAAAAGKLFGWQAANAVLLAWTVLGIGLAFTWFCVLTRAARRGWILLVAALFSGPDLVGFMIFEPIIRYEDAPLPSGQLDWWAQIGKYPGHVTSMMWGPHHAIGAWIGAAAIVYLARTRQLGWIVPIVAFNGLLSPFVTLGFLPLVLWAVWRNGRSEIAARTRQLASVPAGLAALAVVPVLAYYMAILASLPEPFDNSVVVGFSLTNPIRTMSFMQALGAYLMLITLEVIIFYVLVRRSPVGQEPESRFLLGVVTVTMILFPLVRYGQWSDLALRAVVPSMFVLSILVARVILDLPRSSKLRLVFLYLLVVGLKAPQMELQRAVTDDHAHGEIVSAGFDASSAENTVGIVILSESIYLEEPRFLAQYNASSDTFFARNIARG